MQSDSLWVFFRARKCIIYGPVHNNRGIYVLHNNHDIYEMKIMGSLYLILMQLNNLLHRTISRDDENAVYNIHWTRVGKTLSPFPAPLKALITNAMISHI
ncbi:hypothetical protein L1987_40144 [Smallanthus sonchifolius]|uniref:Uncharacterized protein n=1 Tax=Smallanthus sonchifolius TaxID=185202 RepID=A0ACB9GTP5_9ASTR|nr:hypothetical protein L1987_40144 [Smallanthus sonchifolius]